MSLSNAVPDAKALEGRKDGENRPSFQSRDFFLDSVTIFVVGAILALSAIDVVSEFIRRSRVQCFFDRSAVNDSFENVGEYVNEKCAASLPPTEYLPAFISVHAILILAPHYIWQNVFGASLDSFSHLVSGLSRTRHPNTGDYPENNYVISRQLDALTSGAHRSNYMYRSYLAKLIFQLLFAVGGLVMVGVSFRDFNDSFTCPGNMEDTLSDDWPLTGERVKCVFTSLRLLHKIWFVYLIQLVAALICITLSFLILLFTDHTKELGLEKVSELFFQTSLQFEHYTPCLTFGEKLSHAYLAIFPFIRSADSSVYRIQTDYDFLLVKLFRTDGGLAQVLREVHLLRLLKNRNNVELASVSRYNALCDPDDETCYSDDNKKRAKESLSKTDLGWSEIKPFFQVPLKDTLLLPPTIRGVVLGLSARCVGSHPPRDPSLPRPTNKLLCGALCFVFDSESIGFAGALARVFQRVGIINFSKSFTDYENPVRVNVLSSEIVSITAPHDIVLADRMVEIKVESKNLRQMKASKRFYDLVGEIWYPKYLFHLHQRESKIVRGEEQQPRARDLHLYFTDYIVVGPTSSDLQRDTVDMFLKVKGQDFVSDDAVLLTITPRKIAGVKLDQKQFADSYTPYRYKKLSHTVMAELVPEGGFSWPLQGNSNEGKGGEGGQRIMRRSTAGNQSKVADPESGRKEGESGNKSGKLVLKTGSSEIVIGINLFTFEKSSLLNSAGQEQTATPLVTQ